MSKRTRQQAILDIVCNKKVPSQAALAEELKAMGFEVTQATLSRDIAELELVKARDGYQRPEDASGGPGSVIPDPVGTLRRLILKVDEAQNLLVIRTPPGSAQPIAIVLEDGNFKRVIGTLGGDDTCLVVTKDAEEARLLKEELLNIIR
jgi:transcriptional regulator of arginine metabolism